VSYTGPSTVNPGATITFSATVTAGSNCLASIQPGVRNGDYNQHRELYVTSPGQSCNLNPGETGTYTISITLNTDLASGTYSFDNVMLKDISNNTKSFPQSGSLFTILADNTAPSFSQEISASSITSNSINLSWQATDASGINYYKLKCGIGNDADNLSPIIINSNIGLNTNYSLTSLQANTTYACEVTAFDLGGSGNGNANGSKISWTTLTD
tara:strand:+ start:328 stop:966 length:639 start_codon:yes stop_codon:yes gene_type:complete